jgi:hypothetical protein
MYQPPASQGAILAGVRVCALALAAVCESWCAGPAPPPRIDSVFPIGGQPGTVVQATIRGGSLAGAYGLFFAGSGITATVGAVDTEPSSDPKRKPADLLRVELRIDSGVKDAYREFRVLTPSGISNPLRIHLHREPSWMEKSEAHDEPGQAQRLEAIPVAVQGRIAQVGEVDYYAFRAAAGEELCFRTRSSEALDPGLGIYKLTGSWFDPSRATRLAFTDEAVAYPGLSTEALLRYKFAEAGEYLVRVNGFWGNGGAGQDYALLISREPPPPDEDEDSGWEERRWTRAIAPDRIAALEARAAGGKAGPIPVIDADAEPTEVPVKPPRIALPAMVVGSIERPGDIDRVRFSVKEGDRLAFEIETPEKTVPLMNPLLRVLDSDGNEAFTNILSVVNSNGNVSKQIHPKTQIAFPREGEFTLEIRDITASYGDKAMRYTVLVRPQVPHMGAVRVAADCLNLVAGKAQKLSIVTEQEEGFDGYVILSMEGLPEGVRAATATEVEPDSPPPTSEGKRERFVAKSQKATLLLIPEPTAPVTREPAMGRVFAQPVVRGELGRRFLVKEIPVMVVKGSA